MPSPYTTMPDRAYWRRAVSPLPPSEVDPLAETKLAFTISSSDRVMTAGSCFAQNIAHYLAEAHFNLIVTEKAHPIAPRHAARDFNYGVFTARYGNIYTARQLLQLLRRAYDSFHPREDLWE